MDQSFTDFIENSSSVLILLPTKPYFDQVAAGLSMYLSLRDRKPTQVFSPSPMLVEFNRLIGVNKVSQELGNKNLVISFSDYQANDIERVSYDIENEQFRLTVIPKERVAPPSQNQVQIGYSGVTADTVILIGGANDSHFPTLTEKELAGAKLIHVGIRDINLSGKKVISFSRPASSVSEVVGILLKNSGFEVNEDIATNLLSGIESASSGFSGAGVTAETFALVSELMRAGGRRDTQKEAQQQSSYPSGAAPSPTSGNLPQSYPPAIPQVQQVPQTQKAPQPTDQSEEQPKADTSEDENAPKDWFEPKIFKGSSVK